MKYPYFRGALVTITLLGSMAGSVSFAEEIIHQEKSLYRNIIVKESRNRRCLVFSVKRQHRNQTCMDLKDPKRVVFPYVRMTFAGLLVNPEPQKTLMIGLGGGTISKILMELYPDMSLDLVEVDAAVVMVAKNYFGFEESGRTKVHITDGRVFTRRALIRGLKYDLIILDAFTGEYIPEHLMTQEFLTEVKSLLAPGGVVVANTFATSALYDHESVTYSSVFGDFLNLKMPGTGNRVILAVADQLPNGETLSVNAQRLSPLLAPYSVSITGFPRYLARKPDWDQDSRILTDQFAPVNLLRGEPRSHPSKGGSE